MLACLRGGAAAAGCDVDLELTPIGSQVLDCGPLVDAYVANAAAIDRAVHDPEDAGHIYGSTDLGRISRRWPSIHPVIKVAPEGIGIHERAFTDAAGSESGDAAALDGARALAMTVVDLWTDPALLVAARAALDAEPLGGSARVHLLRHRGGPRPNLNPGAAPPTLAPLAPRPSRDVVVSTPLRPGHRGRCRTAPNRTPGGTSMRTKKLVASIAVIAGLTGGALATSVPAIVTGSTATAGQPGKLEPRKAPSPSRGRVGPRASPPSSSRRDRGDAPGSDLGRVRAVPPRPCRGGRQLGRQRRSGGRLRPLGTRRRARRRPCRPAVHGPRGAASGRAVPAERPGVGRRPHPRHREPVAHRRRRAARAGAVRRAAPAAHPGRRVVPLRRTAPARRLRRAVPAHRPHELRGAPPQPRGAAAVALPSRPPPRASTWTGSPRPAATSSTRSSPSAPSHCPPSPSGRRRTPPRSSLPSTCGRSCATPTTRGRERASSGSPSRPGSTTGTTPGTR